VDRYPKPLIFEKTLENGAKFGFVSSILVEIGGFVF